MRRFGTYLFIRTLAVFAAVLFTLVGIAWVTQALRRFDLVTAKGQAIAVYLGITMLALPQLMGIVAPFSLAVAMAILLSQLHAESGIIAINAAGVSPRQFAVPFLLVALIVWAMVSAIVFTFGPVSGRTVASIGRAIRADVITNVIQPGRFTEIDDGITFHIRDRAGDGSLVDLFISDERDETFDFTYTAQRGRIAEVLGRSMLVMEKGTVERTRKIDRSSTFVAFGSYAFDLSQLTPQASVKRYSVTEMTLPELVSPDPSAIDDDVTPDTRRTEIMNRVAEPLYTIAMALAILLFLGYPRTGRLGQAPAVIGALFLMTATRMLGYGLAVLVNAGALAPWIGLAAPVLLILAYGTCLLAGLRPHMPRMFGRGSVYLTDILLGWTGRRAAGRGK